MKSVLPHILVFTFFVAFSPALFGQTNSSPPAQDSLNSALNELMHVAPATDRDLSNLPTGKQHWFTFWRRDAERREQTAAALRRNLEFVVPSLVHQAQNSPESISVSFKLYNGLGTVSDLLDSLIKSGARNNKAALADLSRDLADMNRIRDAISFHIQQTAATVESQDSAPASPRSRFPGKIVVNSLVPGKP